MAIFKIDLDNFCEDIFNEMERLSIGHKGHEFVIEAGDREHATELTTNLLRNFFSIQLRED